jgi:hypothetical protein
MKYAKPEVAVLAPALDAVKSGNPSKPLPHIIIDNDGRPSNAAYEADE